MEQKPPSRLGVAFGLGLILLLAILDVVLITLVILAPVTPSTVLRALIVFLTWPVIGMAAVALSRLNAASYVIDRNNIQIRWGKASQSIPISSVEEIFKGADLGRVTRFRGWRLPGYWHGRGRVEGIGMVQFCATARLDRQLVIKTPKGCVAISPPNRDRFFDLFSAQRDLGPSEEAPAEYDLTRLWELDHGLYADRPGRLLLLVGGAMNVLLLLYSQAQYRGLVVSFSLRQILSSLPDGTPGQLMALSGLATGAWIGAALLGGLLYRFRGERMAAYLLWGAAVGWQLLLGMVVAGAGT